MFSFLSAPTAVATAPSCRHAGPGADPNPRRGGRNKKIKSKRVKSTESSDSAVFHDRQRPRPPLLHPGLNPTSWSASDASQSTFPMAYPTVVPGYPLQVHPRAASTAPHTDDVLPGFGANQSTQVPTGPPFVPPVPYMAPMVSPVVALVLPNYIYPPVAPGPLPQQPACHAETGGFPSQVQPFVPAPFPGQGTVFAAPPPIGVQHQLRSQNFFAPQAGYLSPSFHLPPSSDTPKAPAEGQSRSSTPQSGGRGDQTSPPLFQSRCSSPLNLLELEFSVERQDSNVLSSGGHGGHGGHAVDRESGGQSKDHELKLVNTFSWFAFSSFLLLPQVLTDQERRPMPQ